MENLLKHPFKTALSLLLISIQFVVLLSLTILAGAVLYVALLSWPEV